MTGRGVLEIPSPRPHHDRSGRFLGCTGFTNMWPRAQPHPPNEESAPDSRSWRALFV